MNINLAPSFMLPASTSAFVTRSGPTALTSNSFCKEFGEPNPIDVENYIGINFFYPTYRNNIKVQFFQIVTAKDSRIVNHNVEFASIHTLNQLIHAILGAHIDSLNDLMDA
eukprot:gb/GECG01006510.1/.p1 GENE.gb/GECG01006510.1/~~gb/GECG01006510.1/.p1  ORF type:complete len:111 (+),score=10.53 gb/GECG01006510.1/:1-333(+)